MVEVRKVRFSRPGNAHVLFIVIVDGKRVDSFLKRTNANKLVKRIKRGIADGQDPGG